MANQSFYSKHVFKAILFRIYTCLPQSSLILCQLLTHKTIKMEISEEDVPKKLRCKFYFWPHLMLLRWTGIPIIPLDDFSPLQKILYYIFCVLFLGILLFGIFITEIIYMVLDDSADIDTRTFTLCYLFTHVIGMYIFGNRLVLIKSIFRLPQK